MMTIPNTVNLEIFRDNFIFANSVKRHICDVQIWRPRRDLPILVNDRVISLFCEGLYFTKLRICENKTLAKISEITVLTLKLGMPTRHLTLEQCRKTTSHRR